MKQVKYPKPVFKWWIIFCSLIFVTGYSHLTIDLFSKLNEADVTKLSFLVIIVFYIYMISLGVNLSKYCKNVFNHHTYNGIEKTHQHGWFLSDVFLGIGFLGTLLGFIYMLDLTGLASGDMAQTTLITLTTGMKTALYTTVMALISSIIIKCTLYTIEQDLERIETGKKGVS
jgi:hypothetical protein